MTTSGGAGSRRPASGVVASWIRLGVTSVVAVVQAPILFRHIAPAELGVWYLLFAVANFVSLSDLGLPTALSRAVSFRWGRRHLAEEPGGLADSSLPAVYLRTPVPEIYGSALVATLVLTIAAALAALPAAYLYFQRALEPGPLRDAIATPLLIFVGGLVLNLLGSIPSAYLTGAGDVAWDSLLRTTVQVAGLAAIWLVVPSTRSLSVLCAIYAGQGVLLILGAQVLLWSRHPDLRAREIRPRVGVIRTMFHESLPFFLSRLGLWLTLESTLLIGAYYRGSERIADFAVLRQIVMMGANLTAAIAGAASPHVSAAHAAGDEERVRGLYLGVVRYSLVALVLWTVGSIYWAETVLELLVGPGHFLGYSVLVPLAVGILLGYHAGAHGSLTWSIGRWPFAPVTLSAGALNILFATIGCASYGFPGLAFGPLLAEALTVDWMQPLLALRRVGIPVRSFLRDTALPALSYAAVLTVAGGLVRWGYLAALGHEASRIRELAIAASGIVATAAIGAGLAWVLALTAGDRAYFVTLLSRRRPPSEPA
jgi:O-antigen/teichoic acid export membrane protein